MLTVTRYMVSLILIKARAVIEQLKEELSQFEDRNGIKLTSVIVEGFTANLRQIAQGLFLISSGSTY